MRLAYLWGSAHFLLNFIPTAGPILATVLPLPIVLLDPRLGVTAKITAFVAPTIVHLIVGSVLEPILFGSSMELHPVTVLMALAVWYSIWGVPGAILAVPITAVLRICVSASNHPYARIAANMLEGRLSAVAAAAVNTELVHDGEEDEGDAEAGAGGLAMAGGAGAAGAEGELPPLSLTPKRTS